MYHWLWAPPCSIFYINFFIFWALRTFLYGSTLVYFFLFLLIWISLQFSNQNWVLKVSQLFCIAYLVHLATLQSFLDIFDLCLFWKGIWKFLTSLSDFSPKKDNPPALGEKFACVPPMHYIHYELLTSTVIRVWLVIYFVYISVSIGSSGI